MQFLKRHEYPATFHLLQFLQLSPAGRKIRSVNRVDGKSESDLSKTRADFREEARKRRAILRVLLPHETDSFDLLVAIHACIFIGEDKSLLHYQAIMLP